MPTYDYVCDACGHKFEHFQSINDKLLKKCPSCKKSKLRRLFGTGAAVMFKGSGFYTTDYRSDAYKKDAKADKASGESKSESKSSDRNRASPSRAARANPAAVKANHPAVRARENRNRAGRRVRTRPGLTRQSSISLGSNHALSNLRQTIPAR